MIINIILLVLGFVFLVKGSNYFIESAASIAKKSGVSEFTIGLTLVAIGTSIPELASSVVASLQHSSALVIGNVLGSNIANIGLIIGITALVASIKTNENMIKRDGYIMIFVSFLLLILSFNHVINLIEAIIFLLIYIAYILFTLDSDSDKDSNYNFKEFLTYFYRFSYIKTIKKEIKHKIEKKFHEKGAGESMRRDFIILILGGIAVIIGADNLIRQSIFFAEAFGIHQALIGMSLIAIGTSLPELSVSISAARKGYGNIVIGNIIGSNIANILLVTGISGLIIPLVIVETSLYYIIPFMIFISALLLVFIRSGWYISRKEGIIFLLLYIAFMVFIFSGLI